MNAAIDHLPQFLPARIAAGASQPWVPSSTPGRSVKLLCFLPEDAGFVELLRMEPGCVMPLHRHTGAIHAYNLCGSRELCTGEVIGPGDYVYEPPGNVDSWRVVGEETLVALVVVHGSVEFLDAEGRVCSVSSGASMRDQLVRYCREHGLPMPDLDA